MNIFHLGVLLLIAISVASSYRIAEGEDEVERGDKFIDDFIRDMTYENGHEYDPYVMEDSAIGFWKKVMFVNVSGEAKLFNGYITGLKSLHRADQCTVVERDDRLYVSADLGAGVLNCHYDGTVKFMNWGPTISIYGEIQYVETYMEFSIDAKTGRDGVLEKFDIYDLKGMSVTITGLGPMNWAANYLIGGVTSIFNGFIRRLIERQIRSHIEERLPNYKFPVDDSDDVTVIPETENPETDAPDNDNRETEIPETENPETDVPEIPDEQAEENNSVARKSIPSNNFRF